MELSHNFTLCSACNSQINRDVKVINKESKKIILPTNDASFQQSNIDNIINKRKFLNNHK